MQGRKEVRSLSVELKAQAVALRLVADKLIHDARNSRLEAQLLRRMHDDRRGALLRASAD